MFTARSSNLAMCALGITACLMNGVVVAEDAEAAAPTCNTKEIRELTNGDDVVALTTACEFSMISFYSPSDEHNVEVQKIVEEAFVYWQKMLSDNGLNNWEPREVGWFKLNVDTEDQVRPSEHANQIVMSKDGLSRMLHFAPIDESLAVKSHQAYAEIVRELTGEFVTEIECKKIQDPNRFNYDEVIYLGSQKHLFKEGGLVSALKQVSKWDKYSFDLQRNGFFFNDQPDCRRERDLDPDEPYIIWYNGDQIEPLVWKVEETIEADRLMYQTTIRTLQGTPMWGQRANAAVFEFYQNALVYMTPELLEPDDWVNDWRVNLMVGTLDYMLDESTNFVPLIVPFEQPEEHILMPQLSSILDVQKDDLPNFFIVHPLSDRVVPMPDTLTNPEDFSSEVIMLWAIRQAHNLDIELFEYNISLYDEKVEKGEEVVEEWETTRNEEAKANLEHSRIKIAEIDIEFKEAAKRVEDAKKGGEAKDEQVMETEL